MDLVQIFIIKIIIRVEVEGRKDSILPFLIIRKVFYLIDLSDTNPNSAFSTETENFKVNPFHLIMEANIEPLEWRKEFERVEKLLEIPEYPEFLISGSDNSNICGDVDLVNKVSKYSFYFEKNVKNKYLFILQNIYEAIDIELKQINLFEKVISESDKVKNKVININLITLIYLTPDSYYPICNITSKIEFLHLN